MGKRENTKRRSKRRNKIIKGGGGILGNGVDKRLDDTIKFILEFIMKFTLPAEDGGGYTPDELMGVNKKAGKLYLGTFH